MREEFERVQTQLYEDIVAPHEGELLRFLETVRELVDEIMMDVQARVWYKNPNVVKKDLFNGDVPTIFQYPNGNCYLIVATALEVLEDFIPDEAPYLREFQKRWGVIGRMSGFYQASNGKEILQNFIRAGDRVWDVAYEEMEPEELRKVAVVPFKGGRHREFCSLGEIRRISESYYPGMRYFSSLSALGWVGAFHSSLCFQLPRNYLMQSGKNREFGFDEVSTYLRTVARPLELTPELKARLARAVTDILAFGTQRFTPIESFFLNSVRLHLENPTGDVERHLRHAHDFVSWQAEKTGLSFEEVFVELSDVMEGLIAEISDEYYDRLHAERKGEIGKLNFLEES